MKEIFLTNKDLCTILGVSMSTITRSINGNPENGNVFGRIKPVIVGKAKRWNARKVAEVLGITIEDIEALIG